MNITKDDLKVMSFNILWKDIDSTAKNDATVTIKNPISNRILQLNALLKGEHIDIAGLQEVSPKWVANLATLDSDYAYVGSTTSNTREGGYMLYKKEKLELLENSMFWLAEGAPTVSTKMDGAEFDRICSWAIFKIKETGNIFIFMDTHCDHVLPDDKKYTQGEILSDQVSVLQKMASEKYDVKGDCPLVLVGDMNAYMSNGLYKTITTKLNDARKCSVGTTVSEEYGTLTGGFHCYNDRQEPEAKGVIIDFIFVSDNISVNNFNMLHTTTNLCEYGEYISDHNAITAELVF